MKPGGDAWLFDNDEAGYLAWVQSNPGGFVANVDRAGRVPQYPMIHRARHAVASSPRIGNFTTRDYVNVCAGALEALEADLCSRYARPVTRCRVCMG